MTEVGNAAGGVTYVLRFPRELVTRPIVSDLVSRFGLRFNILLARITPREEGLMVLRLAGDNGLLETATAWLRSLGVTVSRIADHVKRNDTRCTHCGACTSVCPTEALHINRASMQVVFDGERCAGCGECVLGCPARVMTVDLLSGGRI